MCPRIVISKSACTYIVINLSDILVQLENLRNSSEFQKDKDEETKKRNTFNPDDSKEKSNKRRDRTSKCELTICSVFLLLALWNLARV